MDNSDIRKVGVNFTFLSLVQLTNFALPLLVIPYLVRIIGIEKFGIISIAQTVLVILNVIVEFGFNLTATAEVSVFRQNKEKLSTIFSSVFAAKLLLSFVVLIFLLSFWMTFFNDYSTTIFIGFFWIIGQNLIPLWFFQGIEEMKFVTIANLISKLIYAALLFVFVRQSEHFYLVHFLNGLASIVVGVFCTLYIIRKYKLVISAPSLSHILSEFKRGMPIFISNLSISSYNNSSPIILKFFVSDLYIGYYSIAEKVIFALRQVIGVVSQSLYPRLCKLAEDSLSQVKFLLRKIFMPFLLGLIFIGALVYFLAKEIVYLISGEYLSNSVELLQLMALVPFIVAINIPYYLLLLVYNKRMNMMNVIISGAILNILINLVLSSKYSIWGTAYSVILTEIFISAGMVISVELLNRKLSLFRNL